jgi:glutamine synthetase
MNDQNRSQIQPDEAQAFLAAHPQVRFIDAIFIDLCGILRGKRYPRGDLEKIFKDGFPIPYTTYLLDATGESLDPCGRGFSDGDPDGIARPVPGTLVPVPWSDKPLGQVLMTLDDEDGSPSPVDPRNQAAAAVERFKETGFAPVVAFELEFFLIDRERDGQGRPQAPINPATGRRESETQVYGMAQLEAYSAFFEAVEQASRVQGIPASVASTEYAPGQFEINLRHVGDPLAAADHCALQRNIVKQVAGRQGMDATFMPKPFAATTGSGMHLHVSLLDSAGKNAFDDGSLAGNETLRHAIGGLGATLAEAMAIFAPNRNAYRRFGPNLFVPVSRSWATNNRSVAFRIPAGPGAGRRVEHRVAGADANPYLVLAAVLAGLQHGLEHRIDPGPMAEGNAGAELDPDLPLAWEAALDRLDQAEILPRYLDGEYLELYTATKREELKRFAAVIAPQEYDWYL